jgi:DnaK suppressor protein
MNGLEIEQCRQKLLSLRAELLDLEESSRETAPSLELDQAGMGRLSRKDAMQAQLMAQEGTRLRKRQLQKIDGALRRMEAGEYGKCFVCEEELDASGLSIDPTTTRCVNCVEG